MEAAHDYSYAIAIPLHQAPQPLHAASVKMLLGAVIPTEPWWGRMVTFRQKEKVLEQAGCSFQVDKLLYCVGCGVPKLVSAFQIIKGLHLRGES